MIFGRIALHTLSEALKSGGNRTSNRARFALIGAQTVLAVTLLTAAGLLSRSFDRAMAGGSFDPTHVAQVRLRPGLVGYSLDSSMAYFHMAVDKIRSLPGVTSAAPVRGSLDVRSTGSGRASFSLPGDPPPVAEAPRANTFEARPGFFATLRVPVVKGREFSEHDTPGTPLVVVVNEVFAKQLWKSFDVLGRSVMLNGKMFQVVGVVKDYRPRSFGEAPNAMAYVAFWQMPFGSNRDARIAIRVDGDPLAALAPIRRALAAVDAAVPVTTSGSMESEMRTSYAEVRLGGIVLVASAALTLFLAAVGLYGVVSYLVTQRTKEIAVRLAIGARPGRIVAMLLHQGLRPIVAGGVLGLIVSVAAAPLLSRWLFGIAPMDAVTLLGALAAVTMVGAIASYVPARRAARIDPAAAFRSD